MVLHDEIRRLAAAKGLKSHQAIAEACCVSQSLITRLLSAERKKVTIETLHMLSDGLGVTCDHWRQYFTPDEPAPDPAAGIMVTPGSHFPRGVAQPAIHALANIGVMRVDNLVKHSESELLALPGMSKKAIGILKTALKVEGKSLKVDVAGEDEPAAMPTKGKKPK